MSTSFKSKFINPLKPNNAYLRKNTVQLLLVLLLLQRFGLTLIALNGSFCTNQSKKTDCNSRFALCIIVRLPTNPSLKTPQEAP